MTLTVHGTGYTSADAREAQTLICSGFDRGGVKPAVLMHHGASTPYGTAMQALDMAVHPAWRALIYRIADAGYPVCTFDFGYHQDLYCNDTDLARITDARTWAQTARGPSGQGGGGGASGKVILCGGSMGGGAMMAWARANPSLVACMLLLIPLSDMNDIVVNNRLGLASAVNAVYPGGAYDDTRDGPTHSPVKFAAQLAGIPTQVWYATDDTAVIPSTVQAVVAAAGWTDVHALTGGHSDVTMGKVDPDAVLTFLAAHST